MAFKNFFIYVCFILLALVYGEKAQAIPQCENINISSVSQVKTCISNIPQINSYMPQITDVVTGCQFAKLTFRSGAGSRSNSIPSCSVFSQALNEINSKPPIWNVCANHYEQGGAVKECLEKIVQSMNTNRAIKLDCANLQKMMTFTGASILEPADLKKYQTPSCEVLLSAVEGNQTQLAKPNPAPVTPVKPTVTSSVSTVANISPQEPTNQLRPRNKPVQSNVLYTYRNAPTNYNLKIDAYQDGVCAPRMTVSVSLYSGKEEYKFDDSKQLQKSIVQELRDRCGKVSDVTFFVFGDFVGANKSRQKSNHFFQASAANQWLVRATTNPVPTFSFPEHVPFQASSQAPGLFKRDTLSGRLKIDAKANTATGAFLTGSTPIQLNGTFASFVHEDQSQDNMVRYTIRGNWQGHGNQHAKCFESKNGFSYWGTFSFVVGGSESLSIETCPETANKNSYKAFTYRINWFDAEAPSASPNKYQEEMYARFSPPAGSFSKADPELQARRFAAERQAAIDLTKQRIKPGLVYKPYDYWEQAVDAAGYTVIGDSVEHEIVKTLQNISDGWFKDLSSSSEHLKLIYYSYVFSFDRQCRAYLKDPVGRKIISTETNEYGRTTQKESDTFYVERKFEATFETYYKWRDGWYAGVLMRISDPRKIFSIGMHTANLHGNIMDSVVKKVGCNSATSRQFNENLWRAAHGKPSLHESNETISGAESENEIPEWLQ